MKLVILGILLFSASLSAEFSSNTESTSKGSTVTLTWSSSASNCTASGAWSGTKAGSGTEEVTLGAEGWNMFTLNCGASWEYVWVWGTAEIALSSNSAPVFSGLESTLSVSENQTSLSSVSASDSDGDNLTYSLSGQDASYFSVSSTGVITFNSPPDYETKSSYSVTVSASDGQESTSHTFMINILDVDESSSSSSSSGSSGSSSGSSASSGAGSSGSSSSAGSSGSSSSSSSNSSGLNANVSSLINSLRFKEFPDFEVPTDSDQDNVYEVTINVSDGTETISRSISINVQDVSEDIVGMNFVGVSGSEGIAPKLKLDIAIPELAMVTEVQVLIWPVGQSQTWYYLDKVNSTDWKLDQELELTAIEGNYEIRQIRLVRANLSDISLDRTYLANKGFATLVEIANPNKDSIAPVLNGIESISVEGNDGDINTSITITVVALVEDTNLDGVGSYIQGPGGGLVWSRATLSEDKKKATLVYPLDFKTGTGNYIISDIRLSDEAGNERFYGTSEIDGLGFTSSVYISNLNADNNAPEITDLIFTAIETGSNKEIKVEVTTGSQDSAISRIFLRMKSSNSILIDKYIYSSNSGDASKTSFELQFALPSEFPSGKYMVDYMFIADKALNEKTYYADDLDAAGLANSVTFN